MHNGLHKYSISRLYKSTVIIFIETLSQSLLYGSHEAPEHCSEQSGCCAMPLQGVSAPLLITVMSPRLFPGSSGKWFPAGSPSQGKAVLGGWRLNGRSQVFLPPSCPPWQGLSSLCSSAHLETLSAQTLGSPAPGPGSTPLPPHHGSSVLLQLARHLSNGAPIFFSSGWCSFFPPGPELYS